MTNKCKSCKKNYNILCEDGNCYYCFIKKYKRSPKPQEYGGHQDKKAK